MKFFFKFICAAFLFTISIQVFAQEKKYSLEFEASAIATNRVMLAPANWSHRWRPEPYNEQSKILPGFYMQFGANFREDKRTIFYAGLRLMDQRVMTSVYNTFNVMTGPNGADVDGNVNSQETDMIYLNFPFLIKKNLISKPNFKLLFSTGLVPGLLIGIRNSDWAIYPFPALSYELGLSIEKQLDNGNYLGLKFPMFSYALFLNDNTYYENTQRIMQFNYSLGLGFTFKLGKKSTNVK